MATNESNTDPICECWKCGKAMTCADVDEIPPEEFHEEYPECETCRAKKAADEEAKKEAERARIRAGLDALDRLRETNPEMYAMYAAQIRAIMTKEE